MPSRSLLHQVAALAGLASAGLFVLSGLHRSLAAEQPAEIPAWLKAHVGDGEAIAPVVLQRARALYLQKLSEGTVKIPATSPWMPRAPPGLGAGST